MALRLFENQLEAVKKMKNGCILCGDTGTGKSMTSLGYYYLLNGGNFRSLSGDIGYKPMIKPKDLYIITTATKRNRKEWDVDMARFLIFQDEDLKVYRHKVVVDSWNNIQKYRKVYGAFFIFDEQRVTGSGPWVKTFLDIARKNQWILLSATPGDKWVDYAPVFIANGFFKNKTEFERQHVMFDPYVKWKQVKGYMNEGYLIRLRNSLLVDIDRIYNPNKIQHEIICEFDRPLYKSIMKNRWDPFENQPIETASKLCFLLRKVSNSSLDRIETTKQILREHDRVIVFYNYDFELAMLKNTNWGCPMAEWNGHRHEVIPNGDRWIYFVHYLSGAEGWNCITCNTIVFYSQNYSYKTMIQASGRIDRSNSPYDELYYYTLRSNSPIDKSIKMALIQKKDFNEKKFMG